MLFTRLASQLMTLGIGALLAVVCIWLASSADAAPNANLTTTEAPAIIQETVGATPMISYQGRLLDALTGEPKPDGAYTMAFRLYTVDNGGSALWTESKSVTVNKGLFTTLLGDTTALNLTLFDGQALFLGVTVGTDPETAPRQQLSHVAYAIYAETANNANNAATL